MMYNQVFKLGLSVFQYSISNSIYYLLKFNKIPGHFFAVSSESQATFLQLNSKQEEVVYKVIHYVKNFSI